MSPPPCAASNSTGGPRRVDVVIRGGTIHDGSGTAPHDGDVVIEGDRIVEVGGSSRAIGRLELDARGLAVAPGFINMLSWATESLLVDGRSESDIRQGVTLEVFGEGTSMGPLTPGMREALIAEQGDLRYDVPWSTLAGYLDHLVQRGVSPNVGSFVGATTVRVHELDHADRAPTRTELARMVRLVDEAMREGALGVGSSLIYAPAAFARTDELIALATAAARRGGMYISHVRGEGETLVPAIDELLEIARAAGSSAEIYHLKALGPNAPATFDAALGTIEHARAEGLRIGADMYPYPASATGLDAAMPPWVQEGGVDAWIARLRDPATRSTVVDQMRRPGEGWENHLQLAGDPSRVQLAGFHNPRLQRWAGRTLADVATERGLPAEEAAIDLVIEDGSRVETIYFNQAPEVVDRVIRLPWVAFGSDAGSLATRHPFLSSHPHPRAYGTFARVLGHYVRDERALPLPEAIRRLTAMPAATLGLTDRGRLAPGCHADVVVFDPERVADRATFREPHRYAEGIRDVVVNGVHTLADGEHTGARAGQVVRGPGARRSNGSRAGIRAASREAGGR